MKTIELTKGAKAIVDECDYDYLMQWKWLCNNTGYAVRTDYSQGKKKTLGMHRVILSATDGVVVDHKNGNRLDNRRSNIRVCTPGQNQYNRGKLCTNKTGYKGVYHQKKFNTWLVAIGVNGKLRYVGSYKTKIEAARAYNEAALKYHGEFARLNDLQLY
jgi:hypothetical protein